MAKSIVSIVKGTDPEKMVHEALSLLGGVENLIRPGTTVILKPNAGHKYPPESSVNTNPELVGATVREMKKANPKEVIVAEAAAMGEDTLACFEESGIGKAAEDAGARVIDIKREKDLINVPIRNSRSDLRSVLLPRFVIEAEHLVDMPIFKSHVAMTFTCALKNMKGLVQDKVHYQMHQTNLADAMMDLWSVCPADLTIADLIRPAEGYGPHAAMPTEFGCIVASKDPVALDATACRMVGLDITKVAYFKPAVERKLGVYSEKSIEIRGKSIEEVFKQLWLPYMGGFEQWPEYNVYAEHACSSCLGLIGYSLEKVKSMPEKYSKRAGTNIVVGRHKELPKGVKMDDKLVLVGDCTKRLKNQLKDQGFDCLFVEGCPPGEGGPAWAIGDAYVPDMSQISDADIKEFRKKMEEEMPAWIAYCEKLKAKQLGEKAAARKK
jgi:uncharacterized protein (DUF362 family)